jgi:hypothetical protein
MFAFYLVWPYMGLGAALLLALLLTTDALRSDFTVSRWQDLVWLAWLGTLAYLIHQFEEHGIDALGATYAFRGEMCRNFGFPDVLACPIPFSFVTAVNISVVWVFGPATALLGRAGRSSRSPSSPCPSSTPSRTSSRQWFRAPTMRAW